MKYFVRQNMMAKHGYELVVVDDNNVEKVTELRTKTTDNYLVLPEIIMGRKMLCINMIKSNSVNGLFELTENLRTRRNGTTVDTQPKVSLIDSAKLYLEESELEVFRKLLGKINRGKALEQARLEVERTKKLYEELLAAAE